MMIGDVVLDSYSLVDAMREKTVGEKKPSQASGCQQWEIAIHDTQTNTVLLLQSNKQHSQGRLHMKNSMSSSQVIVFDCHVDISKLWPLVLLVDSKVRFRLTCELGILESV